MTRARPLLAASGLAALVAAWWLALAGSTSLLPTPPAVALALVELARSGLLVEHVVASLFRVTWGYLLAVALAIPLGMLLGWRRRTRLALAPLLALLRPISPLAWIPIAILWFGVGDLSAVFIIFLASFLPLILAVLLAVRHVPQVNIDAGRNFGLGERELLARVIFPAIVPQVLVALRLALGIAWLVVVAAEMIAVDSGLGFLIIDARNAGNRYDLVVAGMVAIGVIGLGLDLGLRRLEHLGGASWSYAGGVRA